MNVNEKLIRVREQMTLMGLDALLVMSEDPHGSEYPANHWKFREYLSGFNGSAGVLLITKQYVDLWTDSRYYIQAEKQLRGTSISLFKAGKPGVPDYVTTITNMLPSGSVVGIDGFTISIERYRTIAAELERFGISINYKVNIIDEVFTGREPLPQGEIVEGQRLYPDRKIKLRQIRETMLQLNVTHYLVTALDDVAWVTNLRCNDMEYNPLFYAYMIITPDEAHLYVDPHKLTTEISKMLDEDGFKVSLYDHFEHNISHLPDEARIYYDPRTTNTRNCMALPQNAIKIEGRSIIENIKAVKGSFELRNLETAFIDEGLAMTRLFYWIETTLGKERITEIDVVNKLIELRKRSENYIGESFQTIAAFGSNAAIVHYAPTIESNRELEPNRLFLIDAGAQYTTGTTDITRTIPLGEVSTIAKEDYTLVLKGNITLARAKFPHGTCGMQLDTLARMHMWKHSADYGHSTGHGVGYCLCVHEGPQLISKSFDNRVPIVPGMITSDEPGIYRKDMYGVRIENLLLCEQHSLWNSSFGKFYGFTPLTLCYIDTSAIIPEMLTENEKNWINEYHVVVYRKLSHFLLQSKEPEIAQWLHEKIQPI